MNKTIIFGIIGAILIISSVGGALVLSTINHATFSSSTSESSTTTTTQLSSSSSANPTSSSSSSTNLTSSGADNSSGILTVTCIGCVPAISIEPSQYLVTIGWNMVYPNSAIDNVSDYQSQNNTGTTSYFITAGSGQNYWFVDWLVQMQSKSGGVLTVTFTLDGGATIYSQSTKLFPDIVQGNYSSDQTYATVTTSASSFFSSSSSSSSNSSSSEETTTSTTSLFSSSSSSTSTSIQQSSSTTSSQNSTTTITSDSSATSSSSAQPTMSVSFDTTCVIYHYSDCGNSFKMIMNGYPLAQVATTEINGFVFVNPPGNGNGTTTATISLSDFHLDNHTAPQCWGYEYWTITLFGINGSSIIHVNNFSVKMSNGFTYTYNMTPLTGYYQGESFTSTNTDNTCSY